MTTTLPSTAPACRRWILSHLGPQGRVVHSEYPTLIDRRHQVQIFDKGYIETYGKSAHVAYRRAMEAMNERSAA